MKQRLDQAMVEQGLAKSRSQAKSLVMMGHVNINGEVATKAGYMVGDHDRIKLLNHHSSYVSRAGNKLESVAEALRLDFKDKVVLDVGSSTGGFTDYALRQGAQKVIAVDVGTEQLHPSLRADPRIELHEKTDIRDVGLRPTEQRAESQEISQNRRVEIQEPDIVVVDVSFISLRDVLPHISNLLSTTSQVVAMLKPQFEAGEAKKHKGVIKNSAMRRQILQNFELWARSYFVIQAKQDSKVFGMKGNQERFYLLKPISKTSF